MPRPKATVYQCTCHVHFHVTGPIVLVSPEPWRKFPLQAFDLYTDRFSMRFPCLFIEVYSFIMLISTCPIVAITSQFTFNSFTPFPFFTKERKVRISVKNLVIIEVEHFGGVFGPATRDCEQGVRL